MHILAILTIAFNPKLFLMIYLIYFHKILFGSGDNKSLHLVITFLNSSFEDGIHSIIGLDGISSKQLTLI